MSDENIKGEGDPESAKNFNEKSKAFVKSEGGDELAKKSDHTGNNSPEELADAAREAADRAQENGSNQS